MRGGGLGVVVFFTLSGVLITLLLTREFDRTGPLGLPRFHLRRALRLFPALVAVLVVCVVGAWLLLAGAGRATWLSEVGWAAVYGTNLHLAALPTFPPGSYLGHTWSLSVEEQFSLPWPVLLLALRRARWSRRVTVALVVGGAVAAALSRAWLSFGGRTNHAAYGLHTNAVGLLLAAALGLSVAGSSVVPAGRRRTAATVVSAGSALVLAVVTVVGTETVLAHGLAEVLASPPRSRWRWARPP